MTNPTFERAAKALADHFGCEWETMRDADRETIKGYARVVLTAVQSDAHDLTKLVYGQPHGQSAADFIAMIDGVLKDGAQP